MDGSRKGLTSNAHLGLAVRVEHRTYGLNLQAGTAEQLGTARHPSDLPNGPACRAGRCDAMRRKHHLRYQGRCAHLRSLARSRTTPMAAGLLLTLAALLAIMPAQAQAQGEPQLEPCAAAVPTPTAVEVTAVPIVVTSTTADYFVLYVTHDVDADTSVEIPVLVKRGEAGTTTLAENVEALPAARYRVEQYLVSDPADVDGDCVDDITELGDPVSMNPVNPAAAIALSVGAVAIPDRDTFDKLSYSDKYIKFVMFGMDTADRPGVYFMNTENYPDHRQFMEVIGLDWEQDGLLNGELGTHVSQWQFGSRPDRDYYACLPVAPLVIRESTTMTSVRQVW